MVLEVDDVMVCDGQLSCFVANLSLCLLPPGNRSEVIGVRGLPERATGTAVRCSIYSQGAGVLCQE